MASPLQRDGTADAVENRIRSIVLPRRIAIREFVQRFDPLHHRVVNQQQFIRALDQSGVSLNRDEARLLCRVFADEKTGGVRYHDFCASIDSRLGMSEAAKQGKRETTSSTGVHSSGLVLLSLRVATLPVLR